MQPVAITDWGTDALTTGGVVAKVVLQDRPTEGEAMTIQELAASYRTDGSPFRNGKVNGRMHLRPMSDYFQIQLLGYVERNSYRYRGQYHQSVTWREPVPAHLGGDRATVVEVTMMTYRWRRNPNRKG